MCGCPLTWARSADTINGSSGEDFIRALAGDDSITGGKGNDRYEAGAGDDWIVDEGAITGLLTRTHGSGGLTLTSTTWVTAMTPSRIRA